MQTTLRQLAAMLREAIAESLKFEPQLYIRRIDLQIGSLALQEHTVVIG